ncbi:hypothetical protein DK843_22240 [Chromobacterium phragmitis]|uniref:Response regulatory domain-containing protein n=1 Tax=Chromobacterium phragmitis TaxID=2202141 RepID=A0A344UND3_9NEIS|nr:hypothetical protein DK843_22240 [Chromobacterium phragmitis]
MSSGVGQVQSGKILLVEDHSLNLVLLEQMLEWLGLEADVAEDGERAVEMACGGVYRLVLMDIQLPGMDGVEAARQIRGRAGIIQPVIVAMTASAYLEERRRCLEAGMEDVLIKPFKLVDIKRVIDAYLEPD